MALNQYGAYVWEDVNLYAAGPGDAWDDIATVSYGDPLLISLLLYANPNLADRVLLEGGEVIEVPIIDLSAVPLTPPWRRGAAQ